jgi:Protein of unknown function (DUF4245)
VVADRWGTPVPVLATRENEGVTTPTMNRPRRGYTRSASGLVGALIAVFGLIAVMGGLTWLLHRPVGDPARTVDYSASLVLAREQAPFHVVFPAPLPSGLRATSVSWDGVGRRVSWHVGFITENQDYIGLYQGNGPAPAYIEASTPATEPGAPVMVDGETWQTLTNSDQGETALVRTVDGVTTVVTGTTDESELATFANRLH